MLAPILRRSLRADGARLRARLLLAMTAAGLLSACGDGASEVQTFVVDVQVTLPETFAQSAAAGARVLLTSTERNVTDTVVADAQGLARFPRVLPGSYIIASSLALDPDRALALTGQRAALTLNALDPVRAIVTAPAAPFAQRLSGSRLGDLVIKEVYYPASRTPSGGTYFSDQFVEIYNNATDTVYADGLLIADAFGPAGQINPTTVPTPLQSQTGSVFVSSIYQIPGTGRQHPIAPGRSIVIAQDGIDHRNDPNGNTASPVNLATADWETFNLRPDGRDLDSPSVPNLTRVVHRGGFDWLLPVFGPGVVIFRSGNVAALDSTLVPGTTGTWVTRVPNELVVDAFEALQNGNSAAYKRIPAALDAGFVFATGTYTSESARRRVATTIGTRRVLRDSNNSSADFEIIARPTPRGFAAP
ncbi:DUF4876 domain-containing protein [Gemmatimonas sp.]|uniref:DUF4876 domain-containing protein n=1 Tax=Gemmatimonas sp. TaxID=1962908 RepID=UPI00333FDFF0